MHYYLMCCGLIVTWGCFIMFGDPELALTVVYSIAGWQVGSWTVLLAKWATGRK